MNERTTEEVELENIWRLRDLNEDEKAIIKETEKLGKKNKMTFLLTEETAVKQEDVERIEFIKKNLRKVPETWKEDYAELRKKNEEDSKRTRKLPRKTVPVSLIRFFIQDYQ